MDMSTTNFYPGNNPNQIIKNMARELEESTVGPSQNLYSSQSSKHFPSHE